VAVVGRLTAAAALGITIVAGHACAASATSLPYQAMAERLVGAGQGVFARAADGSVLAAVASDRPVHPASVSKIPTTLALLTRLGPEHRFVTRIRSSGPPLDGALSGPLIVEAGGDPTLVEEHAVAIAGLLRARGVYRVTGGLSVTGRLLFDWRPDPTGIAFRRALVGPVDEVVLRRAAELTPLVGAGLVVSGTSVGPAEPVGPALVVHRSAPLVSILKALNSYSNNVFHDLADEVGGVEVVEQDARGVVPTAWRQEIHLDNGAGAGTTNRLSPRATVAIVDALVRALADRRLSLSDVLPVAGRDVGTLHARLDDAPVRGVVVAKTGTYGSLGACALAGVMSTERWGDVTFAILNRGVPVPEARRRQDAFVRAVLADAGARPAPYDPPDTPVVLAAELH